MTHGVVEYGKALRLLGWITQDPTIWYGLENIVATLLLNLYEVVTFTNRHGWIQYAGVHRRRGEPERRHFIVSNAYHY